MKTAIARILLPGLLIVSCSVLAREYNNIQFPDQVTLNGTNVPLQINGVGMRTKFIFDVYIGALYTAEPAKSRNEVLALNRPNRIVMHFVYDEVPAEKLVSAWNEGFHQNQSEEKLAQLEARIDRFNGLFRTVHKDDVILLDYVPGKGTIVNIGGEDRGVIEGEDFNKALLDIWLGDEPADDDLKEAMLGRED